MGINTHDEQLLKRLTVAITEKPRANTKEIAEASGISRATFNRFCGSRDNLVTMIVKQAEESLREINAIAMEDTTDYISTVKRLLDAHINNQEYLVFLCSIQNSMENQIWDEYLKALDTFFLNGQKQGVFRLDLTAQMISELFVAMICGAIDANRRGRVANVGIKDSMALFFLNGTVVK